MESKLYYQRLIEMRDSLPEADRKGFDEHFSFKRKNQTHIFVYSVFLGWLGVDRFALGQPVLGILKLLTLGGFLIWAIVDLFLVGGSARKRNLQIAQEYIEQPVGGIA